MMVKSTSDVAFTPTVKAAQEQRGSRAGYAKMEQKGGWRTVITDDLVQFIAARDSFYFATASADGQPSIQHRGGPPGFLKVLNGATLGFADFGGNRQYISVGNLDENAKAHIFLMDYANQRRIKLWGRARYVENDAELLQSLIVPDYGAQPERAILFDIAAWDINCPKHITRRYTEAEIAPAIATLELKIEELQAELQRLRGQG